MSLEELRLAVEEKDLAIIKLIAERMKIVQEIACEKERMELPVRISGQAQTVIMRAEKEALRLGLDLSAIRDIFSILIQMSEESQMILRKK